MHLSPDGSSVFQNENAPLRQQWVVTQWSEEHGNDANGKAILSGFEASGRVEGWGVGG